MLDFTEPKVIWAQRGRLQIIDIREPLEYAGAHVQGSVNVSLGEIMAGGGTFDPAFPVVVICADGQQSEIAALMLQARGLDAHHLPGGMAAWQEAGLPVERQERAGSTPSST